MDSDELRRLASMDRFEMVDTIFNESMTINEAKEKIQEFDEQYNGF